MSHLLFGLTRLGSPLRFVDANSSSCDSLIPVLVFLPALALARSAPIICCCALLRAGIESPPPVIDVILYTTAFAVSSSCAIHELSLSLSAG